MGKRRRERDRPKSAHDAPYNPNKRVLLSYASDEEDEVGLEEAAPEGTGRPGALEEITANYQIAPYSDEQAQEDQEDRVATDEAPAAEEDDAQDAEVADDTGEDQNNYRDRSRQKPLKNKTTNQLPALGSLSFEWDEDDEEISEPDSDEAEAMAYLRAVRSERQTLPSVFRAPLKDEDTELYDSGVGDGRGYVEDGAYVGGPNPQVKSPEPFKTTIDPQAAYTKALTQRFLQQREQMHSPPEAQALTDLGDDNPITLPEGSNKAYAEWHRLLRTVAPQPSQVQAMDIDTVTRLLALIQRMYLVREKHVSKLISAWIWSLLARLDDVGTMNNDEVYFVREFGKKAVLVQLSFSDPVAARQLEEINANSSAANDSGSQANPENGVESSESPNQTVNGHTEDLVVERNTLATLDMIITVVGEVFGQRDLLEFRQRWETTKDATAAEKG